MTELASLVICSRSGLTYQAGQLEKTGLLRREPDPADDRGVLAVLTDEGRRVLETTAPGHLATVREGILDRLTEEQVAQLADTMDITRKHLRDIVPLHPARPRKGRSSG